MYVYIILLIQENVACCQNTAGNNKSREWLLCVSNEDQLRSYVKLLGRMSCNGVVRYILEIRAGYSQG